MAFDIYVLFLQTNFNFGTKKYMKKIYDIDWYRLYEEYEKNVPHVSYICGQCIRDGYRNVFRPNNLHRDDKLIDILRDINNNKKDLDDLEYSVKFLRACVYGLFLELTTGMDLNISTN